MIAGNKNNLLSLDRKGMHKASIVSQATVMYDLGGSSGFKEEPIRSNDPQPTTVGDIEEMQLV